MNQAISITLVLFLINCNNLFAQEWTQTNGPSGGNIVDIEISTVNSQIIYAAGSWEGLYKSTNGGNDWNLLSYPETDPVDQIELGSGSSDFIYANFHNLSKSNDGGKTWIEIGDTFGEIGSCAVFKIDPKNTSHIYAAINKFDGSGVLVYKSENEGTSWTNISGNLPVTEGCQIVEMEIPAENHILIGINDVSFSSWLSGKMFLTKDDGSNWSEISYSNSIANRIIFSITTNATHSNEIWMSNGSIYNEWIEQPFIYKSDDLGENWTPVYLDADFIDRQVPFDRTAVRVLATSQDGEEVYISGGSHFIIANRSGSNLQKTNLPDSILRNDLRNLAIVADKNKFFVPTRANGVAYTDNKGDSWKTLNKGIIGVSVNLLATHPIDAGTLYAASSAGEGLFKSDDYGSSWKQLNHLGIVHQWSDELLIDPVDPDNVWFVSDVPYIHKSTDDGVSWNLINHPYESGNLNFTSVYAMGQGASDDDPVYILNNGFGFFKGTLDYNNRQGSWSFLHQSEIDYSYSVSVNPNNSDEVLSGLTKKPFQDGAYVRRTQDGGTSWDSTLVVKGAEGITSVIYDPTTVNRAYAASIGNDGGALWTSSDAGGTWQKLNDYFNYTTIHAAAIAAKNPAIAYVAVWGGGLYKTIDTGDNWTLLDGDETFSVASIAIDPLNENTVYIADRTSAKLFKSIDSGQSWQVFFDAGSAYRRLMHISISGADGKIYATAMNAAGSGIQGDVFEVSAGSSEKITGTLNRLPLTITPSAKTAGLLYAVLHAEGVYRTTDNGKNWQLLSGAGSGLPESGFNNLCVDPNNENTLYLIGGSDVRFETLESAGLDPNLVNGIYKSTDGGTSWVNLNNGVLGQASGSVKSLFFWEDKSDSLIVATENGLYLSVDGGVNWTHDTNLPYKTMGSLLVSGNTVLACTQGAGVFKGTIQANLSVNWENTQKVIAPIHFAQLLKHPTDANVLYASAYPGGIFRSDDNGATWHEKNFGMVSFKVDDPARQGYYALSICKSNPKIMYLGLFKRGVYRSFNGGDTWYPVNGSGWEVYGKEITSIVADKSDENLVYIATEKGVYRTTNGGNNWTLLNTGLPENSLKILYQNNAGRLFAGTKGYGLYFLNNDKWEAFNGVGEWGTFWPMWADRPLYQYTSLLIHPENNSRMIMGTFPQGIYKSEDGGTTWAESNIGWTNDGVFRLVCRPGQPETVYAGTYNGINISYDFGTSWEMSDTGWPNEQWVFSIDFDPENPDIMYACSKNGENEGLGTETFHGTVMKSTNAGKSWVAITNGLKLDQEFYQIIVDKLNPQTIYLASQNEGILRSDDAGTSWKSWNEGLSNTRPGTNGNNVTNTFAISADNSMLYFGTAGSGVFRRLLTPILPVQNLKAIVQDKKVLLNWNFSDLNSNFKEYHIYRSQDTITSLNTLSSIINLQDVNVVSYTDEGAEKGKTYYYAVVAVTDNNEQHERFAVAGPIGIGNDTGIKEIADEDIELFPVPARDQLIVRASKAFKDPQITIVSADSRIIMAGNMFSFVNRASEIKINISTLKSGTYIVSIKDNDRVFNKAIVKL